METYMCYHLETQNEEVVAFLSELGFESFVEDETFTSAYVKESVFQANRDSISALLNSYSISFTIEKVLPQNWNSLWEESFQPVKVNDFCMVRADFHPFDPEIQHDVIINPKMAFGTGHHATTYLMMEAMEALDFKDSRVLDYGAGTGILAILASKLGCIHADALDIEWESYQNILENAEINHIPNITSIHGTLEDINPTALYQIILANINRNILIQSCHTLYQMLENGGNLLLSGILEEDVRIVKNTFEAAGFKEVQTKSLHGWSCLQFIKKS